MAYGAWHKTAYARYCNVAHGGGAAIWQRRHRDEETASSRLKKR